MEAHEVIIALIEHNSGEIKGRTKLQKLVFFANELLQLDISYRPYYFGPFSDDVAISVDYLRALKMITETEEHFPDMNFGNSYEAVRYSYRLTPSGKDYFEYLSKNYSEKISVLDKIIKAVNNYQGSEASYKELSIAAKVYYMLNNMNIFSATSTNETLSKRFQSEAKELGWALSTEQIEKSFSLLKAILNTK